MALELAHGAHALVGSAPFLHSISALGEGKLYAVGAYGDVDPGYVLDKVLIRNRGSRAFYVGKTPSEALAGVNRISLLGAEPLPLEGQCDALYIYDPQGSGGTIDADITAKQTRLQNSGRVGHPGCGEFGVRCTPVANATTVFTLYARAKLTLTHIKPWTKVPASAAACTAAFAGPGGNLLTATNIDVTALASVTYAAQTLTATASRLDLNPGDPITITIVGALGLSVGDLFFGLGWSLR